MVTINNYADFISAINEHEVCLVKIGAEWCGPCKVVQKNIENIEKSYDTVYFIDVDAEKAEEIVDKFNVRNIPVILVIKNGQVDTKTVGLQTELQLKNRLN